MHSCRRTDARLAPDPTHPSSTFPNHSSAEMSPGHPTEPMPQPRCSALLKDPGACVVFFWKPGPLCCPQQSALWTASSWGCCSVAPRSPEQTVVLAARLLLCSGSACLAWRAAPLHRDASRWPAFPAPHLQGCLWHLHRSFTLLRSAP